MAHQIGWRAVGDECGRKRLVFVKVRLFWEKRVSLENKRGVPHLKGALDI